MYLLDLSNTPCLRLQLPKSEEGDAEVFRAAGATTIADEGRVPEAPAEQADRTPVLSPALEANATTDGDASGTADAIDNNTATRLPLQLEVQTQLRNPTPASLQAAARQTVQFFVQVHT